jgi:2'-hydroxyisoflavone reductase
MSCDDDYGSAKVACGQAVLAPGPSAVGSEVVVPDDPGFPCAMVDARHLAAWVMELAERRVEGLVTRPLEDTLAYA